MAENETARSPRSSKGGSPPSRSWEETPRDLAPPDQDSAVFTSSEEFLKHREELIRLRDAWRESNIGDHGGCRTVHLPVGATSSSATTAGEAPAPELSHPTPHVDAEDPVNLVSRRDTWRVAGGSSLAINKGSIESVRVETEGRDRPEVEERWLNNEEAFPELSQSHRRHERTKGFGVPMDTASRAFIHEATKDSFPFETIEQRSMKIKSIPIKLQWPRNDGGATLSVKKLPTGKGKMVSTATVVEATNQTRWFRSPPKVQLVAGILGCRPDGGTRDKNPGRGKREVGVTLSRSTAYPLL